MYMAKQRGDTLERYWIKVVLLTLAILLIHLGRRLGWLPVILVIPEVLCIIATLVFVIKYYRYKRRTFKDYKEKSR